LQVVILTERWRRWERLEERRYPLLPALDAMSASTLIAASFGPFAGDFARSVTHEGVRVRAVVADRLSNTALALTVAAVVYAPLPLGVLCAIGAAAVLLTRYRLHGLWVLGLTLAMFVTIALQLFLASIVVGSPLDRPQLYAGTPALLCASLIPLSLMGFSGKEAALPWVFSSLSTESALAMSALLAASSIVGPAAWYFPRKWFTPTGAPSHAVHNL
ncbi:MAG: hypothetical protein AAFY60_16625, partial [Myxococcota bacterium]